MAPGGNRRTPWLFLSPALFLLLAFFLWPTLQTMWWSM